jgi:hypothetical protein
MSWARGLEGATWEGCDGAPWPVHVKGERGGAKVPWPGYKEEQKGGVVVKMSSQDKGRIRWWGG